MLIHLLKLFNSFSIRLYLIYFLMVGGAAWFIVGYSLKTLDKSVNQSAEEVLVDTVNLLAQFVEEQSKGQEKPDITSLEQLMPAYLKRQINASIYERVKTKPNLHVYVTDSQGIVIFDSTNQSIGKDFSHWRDVKRTLAGNYGARSSSIDFSVKKVTEDKKGLFVSAPITVDKHIIGVLTVIKNKQDLGNYILSSTTQIQWYALLTFFISLLAGLFLFWWLWLSIKKLTNYAKQLGKGQQVVQPKIIHSEFKPLAHAMNRMYKDLEGKEYVENYIHTMAHELKSPLTGIIATMELLQQDIPQADRKQFYDNIQDSSERMRNLIDCLLKLATLENKNQITKQTIHLQKVVNQCINLRQTQLKNKNITLHSHVLETTLIKAEPTLLEQILGNLIDNAIDFSEPNASIHIHSKKLSIADEPYSLLIEVVDTGVGLATKDIHRVFERFYSTLRPDTLKRSSGLGLSFVKQAIELHGGKIDIKNNQPKGVKAQIYLP